MIEKNINEYNIKSIRKHFKDNGIFYTPKALSELLKSIVETNVGQVDEVYDPTCGRGALLSVFDDNVIKYGQDINKSEVEVAKQTLVNFNGVVADTLKEPAWMDKKFKAIVGNPPFSISWDPDSVFFDERFMGVAALPPKSKADYAFILHILHYLEDNGCAAVINFPGVLYRGNSEGKIRKMLIEQNLISEVISIPSGYFEDTSVATCIIVFKKGKSDTNIIFSDKELDITRCVSLDEIRQNDYTLSVSSYVQKPVQKEEFDPVATEMHARDEFMVHLKQFLDFSKKVSEFENIDFKELPSRIIQVASGYLKETA